MFPLLRNRAFRCAWKAHDCQKQQGVFTPNCEIDCDCRALIKPLAGTTKTVRGFLWLRELHFVLDSIDHSHISQDTQQQTL